MGTKQIRKSKQPKQKTPTFLLELPLQVEAGQAKRLHAHLGAGRQFCNALLSEGQKRLRRMQAAPAWQRELFHLCAALQPDEKAIRRLQRQMDRQRCVNNPENYDEKGRVKQR
jgi:hypothetical protein